MTSAVASLIMICMVFSGSSLASAGVWSSNGGWATVRRGWTGDNDVAGIVNAWPATKVIGRWSTGLASSASVAAWPNIGAGIGWSASSGRDIANWSKGGGWNAANLAGGWNSLTNVNRAVDSWNHGGSGLSARFGDDWSNGWTNANAAWNAEEANRGWYW